MQKRQLWKRGNYSVTCTTTSREGWESNIMGNSVSGKVDERNIFDILKEVLIKYDEWKNNGNYGEFRYEINP